MLEMNSSLPASLPSCRTTTKTPMRFIPDMAEGVSAFKLPSALVGPMIPSDSRLLLDAAGQKNTSYDTFTAAPRNATCSRPSSVLFAFRRRRNRPSASGSVNGRPMTVSELKTPILCDSPSSIILAPPSCIAFKIPTVSARFGYPAVTNVTSVFRP